MVHRTLLMLIPRVDRSSLEGWLSIRIKENRPSRNSKKGYKAIEIWIALPNSRIRHRRVVKRRRKIRMVKLKNSPRMNYWRILKRCWGISWMIVTTSNYTISKKPTNVVKSFATCLNTRNLQTSHLLLGQSSIMIRKWSGRVWNLRSLRRGTLHKSISRKMDT